MAEFGLLGLAIVAVFFVLLVLFLLNRYRRASKELAFVRTGWGGQKVVMNGGAFVMPVLHETIPVNMNTLRLEVRRANEQALITKDRMRVDVQAEFYVRVKPTEEAIADAAQTLGRRTLDPQALKELVEAKFVDALRSVAAEMAMQELHEQRVLFVQGVQKAVTEDLLKNGLELETVSLTSLDQTNRDYFNPNNAFDAEGLTRLTEEIEARRKMRNDIEQDTQVAVQMKNLEAEQRKLSLARDEEYARLEQQREVEVRRAGQKAEIAREAAAKDREAQEAEIAAGQEVERAQILAKRAVEEERIASEQRVEERRIAKGLTLEAAEIEKTKALEGADIEKKKTIELSQQDREIAVAEKSRALSEAQAEADKARALAARAEEQVVTARETERAERAKAIELVQAAQEAERDAIGIRVAAQAEEDAAQSLASAARTEAEGAADKVRIVAQGEADAEIRRAEAAARRYEVDAEGQRALHEADNILSAEIIAMRVKLALLERVEGIIRESVKPMEAIDGIKIVQLGGLDAIGGGAAANGNGHGASAGSSGEGNLAEQVVNSALRYRAQAPLLDSLLQEVGLNGGSLNDLGAVLKDAAAGAPGGANGKAASTAKKAPEGFRPNVSAHPGEAPKRPEGDA